MILKNYKEKKKKNTLAFKLKKKIDIGDLGRIYLFTFMNDSVVNFDSKFFAIYFPVKDTNDMIITLKYFEDSINSQGIVDRASMLFPILSDYIKCTSDTGKDYSSKRIFNNTDDAVFSVFEKLYSQNKINKE